MFNDAVVVVVVAAAVVVVVVVGGGGGGGGGVGAATYNALGFLATGFDRSGHFADGCVRRLALRVPICNQKPKQITK